MSLTAFSQVNVEEYFEIIDKAESFYEGKNYQQALILYSRAFDYMGDNSHVDDRMRAADAWLQTGNNDSAFYQLKMAGSSKSLNFSAAYEIVYKKYLDPLHSDARWEGMRKHLFLQAFKNLLSDQWRKPRGSISLSESDTTIAHALGEESNTAFMHINDPAYDFLKKKIYDKAYNFFKATIESFDPTYIFYKNMMDYYKATGDKGRAWIYFSRAEVVKYKEHLLKSDLPLRPDSSIKSEYMAFSKMIGERFLAPEYLLRMVANNLLDKGMKENAYSLFRMDLEYYPNNFQANKGMGMYYDKTGNKQKADEYLTKSLLLQYKLPDNFFETSFNIPQYILDRQNTLTGNNGPHPPAPEQFIEDVANHFVYKKMFEKAKQLFEINVKNYPTSFYAQRNMSTFYKSVNDSAREKEFSIKAEEARRIYGTRRSRVFPNGPLVDSTFDVAVSSPVCNTSCPVILIDDIHDNATVTKGWDFITLSNLFSNDGFKVLRGRTQFTKQALAGVNVVVLAGGLLDREEMKILNDWIRNGGSLLAFTHHHNRPIYQEYLLTIGVQTKEIEVVQDSLHGLLRDAFTFNPGLIYFSTDDKLLGNHPVLKGRNSKENIKKVQTLQSSTIIGPPGSANLLPLSDSAIDYMSINNNIESNTAVKTSGSRSLGCAFNFGKGKIVITDAWALKALIFENSERGYVGMNTPGNDNKQYALNIMRWLTGYLK